MAALKIILQNKIYDNGKQFLETLAEKFGQNASVKNVYGEPVTTQGRTIIPVAKIAMGLGGGHGQKNGNRKNAAVNGQPDDHKGEGEGGGGGMIATAKGVYEVTSKCTRFIPANAARQLFTMAALAFVAGRWVGRRKSKKELHLGHKA